MEAHEGTTAADTADTVAAPTAKERAEAFLLGLAMFLGIKGGGQRRHHSKHRNRPHRRGYGKARRVLKRQRRLGVGE